MENISRLCAAFAVLGTLILSGCSSMLTTEGSAPYTVDDVIDIVTSDFAVCKPHIVPVTTQVEKEKPFQRNTYVLYDEANDFSFSCNAVVRRPTLPLPCAQRDTNAAFAYAEAYAAHLNPQICAMTAQYGFRTATAEESAALIRSKVKRRQGNMELSLFDEGDFIFVSNGASGADMVAVCKELYDMYKPEGNGVILSNLYGRKITFYYLPPAEHDMTKAVFLLSFKLEGRNDWAATLSDNPGSSSNEKDVAVLEKNLAHFFERCLHDAEREAHKRPL